MQSTLLRKCHGCSSRHVARAARSNAQNRSRGTFRVYAVNFDPENLFTGVAPKDGLIERRMMAKQMETDKQFAAVVSAAQDEDRKKVLFRRQSRTPPTEHIELVEFFLNTQADDMEVCHWLLVMSNTACGSFHACNGTWALGSTGSNGCWYQLMRVWDAGGAQTGRGY